MKAIILIAMTLVGFQATAAIPNGTYYKPRVEMQGQHSPERLTVITNDKMIDYHVFDGSEASDL